MPSRVGHCMDLFDSFTSTCLKSISFGLGFKIRCKQVFFSYFEELYTTGSFSYCLSFLALCSQQRFLDHHHPSTKKPEEAVDVFLSFPRNGNVIASSYFRGARSLNRFSLSESAKEGFSPTFLPASSFL